MTPFSWAHSGPVPRATASVKTVVLRAGVPGAVLEGSADAGVVGVSTEADAAVGRAAPPDGPGAEGADGAHPAATAVPGPAMPFDSAGASGWTGTATTSAPPMQPAMPTDGAVVIG